ncbi:MAG TPA: hypothetical protein VK691_07705 [Solirubrobacteraceae bacterium]|nr:hypothetical protein [Solirubrobacteraceae bacterium]
MEAVLKLREQLSQEDHDAGAATIAYHLAQEIDEAPSISRRSGGSSDDTASSSPNLRSGRTAA